MSRAAIPVPRAIEILASYPNSTEYIELVLKFVGVGTTLDESGLPLQPVDVCSIASEIAGQITLFPTGTELQGHHFRWAQEVTLGLLSRVWSDGMQKWGYAGNDPQRCWDIYWAWVSVISEFDSRRREAIELSRNWAHRLVWGIWSDRRSLPTARRNVETQTPATYETGAAGDAEFIRDLVNEAATREPRSPFFKGDKDGKLRIGHRQVKDFLIRGRESEEQPHELAHEPASVDASPAERVARAELARRAQEAVAARLAETARDEPSAVVLEQFLALASGSVSLRDLAERTGIPKSTLNDAYQREKSALARMIA